MCSVLGPTLYFIYTADLISVVFTLKGENCAKGLVNGVVIPPLNEVKYLGMCLERQPTYSKKEDYHPTLTFSSKDYFNSLLSAF